MNIFLAFSIKKNYLCLIKLTWYEKIIFLFFDYFAD